MDRRKRILFTIVVSSVGLTYIVMLITLDANYWMLFLATLPLAAGIFFLSFKIWDKKKQDVKEGQEPVNLLTIKQRILLALMITYVFPIELVLATGFDILLGRNLAFWLLIPTSVIMAAGLYFLSYRIWDKKKQDVRENQITGETLTKSQRILFALIFASVVPVELLVLHGLGLVMGVTITLLSLITAVIITIVLVYFLSFKVWKLIE